MNRIKRRDDREKTAVDQSIYGTEGTGKRAAYTVNILTCR